MIEGKEGGGMGRMGTCAYRSDKKTTKQSNVTFTTQLTSVIFSWHSMACAFCLFFGVPVNATTAKWPFATQAMKFTCSLHKKKDLIQMKDKITYKNLFKVLHITRSSNLHGINQ